MFTPGPWKEGRSEEGGQCTLNRNYPERKFPYAVGGLSVYSEGTNVICLITWDAYSRKEREANARLIASAPDLLGKAKRLCESPVIEQWMWDELQETIAKAERREP